MKKRPKSIYKKMWATRRANAAAKQPGTLQGLTVTGAVKQLDKDLANQLTTHRSDVDAIAMTLDMHRDEQLCGFLGDMSAMRRSGGIVGHFPIIVSRSQAEAIEQWLGEQGYTPFGRGHSTGITTKAA